MSDILTQLNKWKPGDDRIVDGLIADAAVEIERLRKELETWQEAHRLMGKKDFYNMVLIEGLRPTEEEKRSILRAAAACKTIGLDDHAATIRRFIERNQT